MNGWKSGVAAGNPAWQASVALGYDGALRVTDAKLTRTDTISGLSLPISEVQPSYDAAGNVSSVTTTLAAVGGTPGGSETQAFCYDDLDRLTWAGTQGTGPCGRAGSEGIAGAGYTASYAYDTFDRLTSASVLNSAGAALPNAAQGTYSYGASGHLHAVSSVGSGSTGYSAAYDAAGELTCRAVGASTCTNATPTGQALGYDALRRLISWQNASTNPTATGAYAYDGSGSRVWQQDTSTSGGVTTTTTTTYILGMAEITSTQIGQAAASTTATRFYPLAGGVSALRDAAGLSYVASDQLGTPLATLNLDTGAVLGEQLRAPYGQARYAASAATNGGMRTTYGFTGQREDATAAGSSGLVYFNARYYDPVVGRFTSPDSVAGSDALLDGYAYVGGQVESATDPSGHRPSDGGGCPGCEPDGGEEGPGEPGAGDGVFAIRPAAADTYEAPPSLVSETSIGNDMLDLHYADGTRIVWDQQTGTQWAFDKDGNLITVNGESEAYRSAQYAYADNELNDLHSMEAGAAKAANPAPNDTGDSGGGAGAGDSGGGGNSGGNGGSGGDTGGGSGSGGSSGAGDSGGSGAGGGGASGRAGAPPVPRTPISQVTGQPMTNPEFADVVQWGRNIPGQVDGSQAALDRMVALINDPSQLQTLRDAGVTPEIAREWHSFYVWHALNRLTNASAAGRAVLMWYLYLML